MLDLDIPKNWELTIDKVELERCDVMEDPLGYRAVFFLEYESAKAERRKFFSIGASYLQARQSNLSKAGFRAPMTDQALNLLSHALSDHDASLETA